MMIFQRRLFSAALMLVVVLVITLHSNGVIAGVTASETVASISPGGAIEKGDSLSWNGKSKKMFDNIVKAAPFFVRSKVESRMTKEIKRRNLSVVTESELKKIVSAVTPSLFLSSTLTAMNKA